MLKRKANKRGMFRKVRKGGRWSEKFFTLTLPTETRDERKSVNGRIEMLREAWHRFRTMLSRWFKKHTPDGRAGKRLCWVRCFEWTPGKADAFGNPHAHFWIFSPYLSVEMVRGFWLRALGLPKDTDARVDVQAVDDRAGHELIKYLVKDQIGGELLDPGVMASVYAALDGYRHVQGSRGFMKLADGIEQAHCDECGAVGMFRVELVLDGGLAIAPRPSSKALEIELGAAG